MKERPILFSAPMVRAILSGTKTQTRREVKPRKDRVLGCELAPNELAGEVNSGEFRNSPYGKPGDRLWVRETWAYGVHALAAARDEDGPFVYAADGTTQGRLCDRWRPSIHMPRAASRITLEITGVRVERLQDISADDARAEGCPDKPVEGADQASIDLLAQLWYHDLWNQINGPGSWGANPWVWVVEFKRLSA